MRRTSTAIAALLLLGACQSADDTTLPPPVAEMPPSLLTGLRPGPPAISPRQPAGPARGTQSLTPGLPRRRSPANARDLRQLPAGCCAQRKCERRARGRASGRTRARSDRRPLIPRHPTSKSLWRELLGFSLPSPNSVFTLGTRHLVRAAAACGAGPGAEGAAMAARRRRTASEARPGRPRVRGRLRRAAGVAGCEALAQTHSPSSISTSVARIPASPCAAPGSSAR